MNICNFRVVNKDNEKKYQSTGLTTLRKRHIRINGDNMIIDFIGKKGVQNLCIIDKNTHPDIFKIFKYQYTDTLREKDYIFQFTKDDRKITINETDINCYLKKFNHNITSKDIRTWSANIIFLNSLINIDKIDKKDKKSDRKIGSRTDKELKRDIKNALLITSTHLHNTPAVCKKSYILPDIISLYLENNQDFVKIIGQYKGNSTRTLLKILSTLEC